LTAENLDLFLFVGAFVAVYVLAASILVRLLVARIGIASLSQAPARTSLRKPILAIAAAGIICIAYGYLIEPYWLDVSHVRINSSKLPADSRPVRIVHISDLHCDPQPRLENRLPHIIANQHPDFIVFTGDCINSPNGLPVFRQCISEIAKIAPTFAVKGNWDAWYWDKLDLFKGTGVTELNGNAVSVDVRNVPIWLMGVAVQNEKSMRSAIESVPHDQFKVFLYHYPDLIKEAAERKVDLYCAGHTHGGQVALPFYGALITLSKYGKRYEAGLYREAETWLYVNRGIGMEGGAPRVRFWARPEVTVIDINPEWPSPHSSP
jgi:hypothetical protein